MAQPIRQLIITFGLWLTATLLAGFAAVMVGHEALVRRHELENNLQSLARVVATNSEAAVMFAAESEAGDLLASLRASPEVVQARLFLPDGSTLARYRRPDAPEPACHTLAPGRQGWALRWCGVALYEPVTRHGEQVGMVALEASLRPTYLMLLRSVVVSLAAAAAAFALSVPLWRRVAARVADPLDDLVQATLHVGQHQDFTRRSEAGGSAEVLALSSAFNRMMQQLQQRDARLHHELGQRRQAEARLNDLAYFDQVTGLHNRHHFMETIVQALQRSQQPGGHPGALLYIDLDGFKRVNDTLGHDQGDLLLRQVAQRLREQLRSTDVVCRLGGDEFAVVLEHVVSLTALEGIATMLVLELSRPYLLSRPVEYVSASIGVCTFPDQATDRETLLHHADRAMYQAKQAGKHTWRLHAGDGAALAAPTALRPERTDPSYG